MLSLLLWLPVGVPVGLLSHLRCLISLDVSHYIGTGWSGGSHLPGSSPQPQGVTPMEYEHCIAYALDIVLASDVPIEDFAQLVVDQARSIAGSDNEPNHYLNWPSR